MHVKLVKAPIPQRFHADNSGSTVLLWCCVFGFGHSVAYGLVCFCVVLVRFGLLSGHRLRNSCSLG